MEQGKRKMTAAMLAAAASLTAVTSAHAVFLPAPSYAETGDAGQTLGTAQSAGAFPGTASTITGTIGGTNGAADADLYSFTLSATTSIRFTVTGTLDTALFLFDSTGKALVANDDGSGSSVSPTLVAGGLAAGTYYIGISLSGNEPINSANQLLFATGLNTSTRGAAAGVNPATLATFNGNFSIAETGAYGITLTSIPEPSTNAALALGGAVALTLVRRFRRRQEA